MGEALCPFGDGRHKRRPWADHKANRSGLACISCSKTWEWHGDELRATYVTPPEEAVEE